MRLIFTSLFLLLFVSTKAQLLSWTPEFIQESSPTIDIIVDATRGNSGLKDYANTTDVYIHIGAITSKSTSSSDWKYVKFASFNTPVAAAQTTYLGSNRWKYTITGGLRNYFGITDATEKVQKIAILFRSGDGTKVQRNSDGSDMYIPIYEAGLEVRLTEPFEEPRYFPVLETINKNVGDPLTVAAKTSQPSVIKLYFNGALAGTSPASSTEYNVTPTITVAGTQTVIAEATSGSVVKRDTLTLFVASSSVVAPLPAGVKDGINYEQDPTAVTLVLFAPGKSKVSVLGDFNNWTVTNQMNITPDGSRFWVRLTGLTSGVEYAYQYLIDGTLKVADYNTEKVLDPANDQFIPAANYPNLKPYPTGKTTGIVSVLQTAKPAYNWQIQNFVRPDKRNLIIYELLVRDFIAAQNWQTLKDTLSYLKKLGINAIEIMPFNEFEGNNSWGYNTSFFFAPDKMYGTENALRQFIDECHKQGIAVIMDIVMNHTFGQSPTVQMYFNTATGRPAANNPWHNEVAKHDFNVGYDINHESQATKDLVDRVVEHWLTK
ncbi:MAG TPA: alpha-amylase family glycosyl hydrolase, partial [Segetibacter sp.]